MSRDDDLSEIAEEYDSSNPHIDITGFAEELRGDMAKGTIIQYIRYLAKLDFNPEDEKENVIAFDEWTRKKARKEIGKEDEDRDTRKRFQYFCYLALSNYLRVNSLRDLKAKLPDHKFKNPNSNSPETRYTEDQLQKVAEKSNRDLSLAIKHMFYGGMRIFEVLNLKPDWYEFQSDRIEVEIPPEYAKGQKENSETEECYLPPKMEGEIKKYMCRQYDDIESYNELVEVSEEDYKHLFEFVSDSDKDFKDLARERYKVNQKLKKAARKSGINKADKITAHRLRKSFIHHVFESSEEIDLNRTSQLARHDNPKLTKVHYLELDKKQKKQDHQKAFG